MVDYLGYEFGKEDCVSIHYKTLNSPHILEYSLYSELNEKDLALIYATMVDETAMHELCISILNKYLESETHKARQSRYKDKIKELWG